MSDVENPSAHTPGPWSIAPASVIIGSDGRRVCSIPVRLDSSDLADTFLIAAAPALLKALLAMIPSNVALGNDAWPDSTVVPIDFTLGELRTARAAIALATGETSNGR